MIIKGKMVVFMSINATGDYTCNQTDSIDMLGDSSLLPWFLSGKWSLTQILLLRMLYNKRVLTTDDYLPGKELVILLFICLNIFLSIYVVSCFVISFSGLGF